MCCVPQSLGHRLHSVEKCNRFHFPSPHAASGLLQSVQLLWLQYVLFLDCQKLEF
jgi:hypothetical protein